MTNTKFALLHTPLQIPEHPVKRTAEIDTGRQMGVGTHHDAAAALSAFQRIDKDRRTDG